MDEVRATDSDYSEIGQYALDRLLEPLRRILRWLAVVLLVILIALPAVQIVLREILGTPFIGAEELARFMMICVAFITFPYVVSAGANIRMEEVQLLMPRSWRRWLRVLISLTGLGVFAFVAVSTNVATFANLNNATPTLGIPYYVFFSATFVGCAMTAVECAIQAVKAFLDLPPYVKFDAERPPEELTEL